MKDEKKLTLIQLSAKAGMTPEEEAWVLQTAGALVLRIRLSEPLGLQTAGEIDEVAIRVLTEQFALLPGRVLKPHALPAD